MTKKELKKYFDILEVSPEATLLEIKSAYSRLKKLYSTDSVVISPIEDAKRGKIVWSIMKNLLPRIAIRWKVRK